MIACFATFGLMSESPATLMERWTRRLGVIAAIFVVGGFRCDSSYCGIGVATKAKRGVIRTRRLELE
jgi:hypothetical protein